MEDDASVAEVISLRLQQDGYETVVTDEGQQALELFKQDEPDLVILDIMLPDMDGISVCREIRRTSDVPIIIVTGRGDKMDRVVGLEVGADDYVVKPFIADELLARVRANLRRVRDYAKEEESDRYMRVGPVEIDNYTHKVKIRGEDVELTPTEFRILHTLAESADEIVSLPKLFEKVWEQPGKNASLVETHVYNLRRKVEEDPASPRLIQTIRDAGYRLNTEAE